MKKAVVNGQVVRVYNLQDAAEEVGLPYITFYMRIMKGKAVYPRPCIKIGKRMYFTEQQVKQIKKAIEKE